ncbi:unnamed protein product [Durusdinium trenchii]|uniref:Caltractin ICL1f (Centrin-6) n=4 Tax=Durusdinium trenchii TaxID=1381693 RepID=A0ABP0M027_9DINO
MGNGLETMCCGRSTKAKAELQRFKISLQNCNTKLDALIQEEIDDLFGKVDVDGSQALDMSEAKSMVSKLEDRGFEFPCEVGAFDQDGDGNIDKQEVSYAVRAALRERPKNLELISNKLDDIDALSRDAWNLIDGTQEGYISIAQFSQFYVELGQVMDEKVPTYQEVWELTRKYDTDSDSFLTYDEFELLFCDYLCRTAFKPEEFKVDSDSDA